MLTFKAKTAQGEIINSGLYAHRFPAGEANIKLDTNRQLEQIEIAVLQLDRKNMHNDLFDLAMWNDYIMNVDIHIKRILIMPYAPAARADRGIPFGAEVYGEFIANMMFDQTIIFDAHSPVIIEKLEYQVGNKVTEITVKDFFTQNRALLPGQYDGVIAPDKGAVKRAGDVADALGVPLYTVNKVRDFDTGKLLSFEVPTLDSSKKYLVVDDICDGGGTFLGMMEAFGSGFGRHNIDLYVSHGVFSGGSLTYLPYKFGKIVTTNSYGPETLINIMDVQPSPEPSFKRLDVVRQMYSAIMF